MAEMIDTDYYARRVKQEHSLADRTGDPVARRVHEELARRYAQMLAPQATS